jgi:hypothetical protein
MDIAACIIDIVILPALVSPGLDRWSSKGTKNIRKAATPKSINHIIVIKAIRPLSLCKNGIIG